MTTYKDFDRIIDNDTHYLCTDTWGRKLLDDYKLVVDNKFKDLKNRYVIIGDSYLEGYNPDGNVDSFGKKLQLMMNASDEDWVMAYYGGTGFVNTVSGKNYKSLTVEAHGRTTNPQTITHVIYAGGYNDSDYTSENIQNAITDCYAKMHELFPNAVMYLADIGSTFTNHEVLWHLHDNVLHAFDCAGGDDKKICSLGYIGNALHERGMLASDGYHPTDWGQWVIALALSYKLRGGEYQPVGRFIDFKSTYSQPSVSVSTVSGKEFFDKEILTLVFHRIDFSTQPSIPTEQAWIVGKTSDLHYVRNTYHYMASMMTTGIVAYNGGANFRTCSMSIGIQEGGFLYVRLHTLNKDDSNYEVLNNIKFIAFDDTTLRVPLSYI